MDAKVFALAWDNSGNLYAGGDFTTAGVSSANYIAKWNSTTSTWSAMGTGAGGGGVRALEFGSDGKLYVEAGNFIYAGVTAASIILPNGVTNLVGAGNWHERWGYLVPLNSATACCMPAGVHLSANQQDHEWDGGAGRH